MLPVGWITQSRMSTLLQAVRARVIRTAEISNIVRVVRVWVIPLGQRGVPRFLRTIRICASVSRVFAGNQVIVCVDDVIKYLWSNLVKQ